MQWIIDLKNGVHDRNTSERVFMCFIECQTPIKDGSAHTPPTRHVRKPVYYFHHFLKLQFDVIQGKRTRMTSQI